VIDRLGAVTKGTAFVEVLKWVKIKINLFYQET
jgi:hypothetical protein